MFASAIDGASAARGMQQRPPGPPPQMEGVAKLFGMSSSELSSELKSGKTLSGLASEKGVSSTELIKTIETELTANKPEGAPALSATQLTEMATGIANGTPPPPPPTGGSGATGSTDGSKTTSTLAESLGVEPSALLEALENGTSLSSLLEHSSYSSDGSTSQQEASGGIAFDTYV